MNEKKYKLAPGTQVREEDFGLLFYTMSGPRLYFLNSGDLIQADFFDDGLAFINFFGHYIYNRLIIY